MGNISRVVGKLKCSVSRVEPISIISRKVQWGLTLLLYPAFAYADFQTSVHSLVTGVVSGVLPAFVMYEAGLAGVAFARKNPDAKDKAEATALGAVAVLGLNGVWSFLKAHIR